MLMRFVLEHTVLFDLIPRVVERRRWMPCWARRLGT